MTQKQLEILQHALGADKYGQGGGHRNHFCAGADDEPDCRALVEAGYMYVFRPNASPYPYYNCAVTEAGKLAMQEASPPKLTRGQKRYRKFLRADTGERRLIPDTPCALRSSWGRRLPTPVSNNARHETEEDRIATHSLAAGKA